MEKNREKRICTICARGGSKGLKNKNFKSLAGKPLVAHTILQAKVCGLADAVVLSSDSEAILEVGREWGVDFAVKRPPEMATDEVSKLPAIRHAVLEVEKITGRDYEVVVDLDPTSPLREEEDIRKALQLFEERDVSNLISASPSRRSPYFNLVELSADGFVRLSKPRAFPTIRRQDSPPCFDMNAAIYIWKRRVLFDHPDVFYDDTALYVMPPERSVDIDCELDFQIVEMLMAQRSADVR